MALSDDLRKRVMEAVVEGGLSRNAAAKRFDVSIASAVRQVKRCETTGEISPAPSGGDHRSRRIEAHRDYLLGLNHSMGPKRSVMDRWSCSIRLLSYFDDRSLVLLPRPCAARNSLAARCDA